MRSTIKFRGKDLETDKWVYGDLLQYNEGGVAIGIHGTFIDDGYHFNEFWDRCPIVDDETIGQFTGLHDCNDKEIYEGDILLLGESSICEVRWNDKASSFCIRFSFEHVSETKAIGLWQECERNIEVIGNVHDNPDLLENEKS